MTDATTDKAPSQRIEALTPEMRARLDYLVSIAPRDSMSVRPEDLRAALAEIDRLKVRCEALEPLVDEVASAKEYIEGVEAQLREANAALSPTEEPAGTISRVMLDGKDFDNG